MWTVTHWRWIQKGRPTFRHCVWETYRNWVTLAPLAPKRIYVLQKLNRGGHPLAFGLQRGMANEHVYRSTVYPLGYRLVTGRYLFDTLQSGGFWPLNGKISVRCSGTFRYDIMINSHIVQTKFGENMGYRYWKLTKWCVIPDQTWNLAIANRSRVSSTHTLTQYM